MPVLRSVRRAGLLALGIVLLLASRPFLRASEARGTSEDNAETRLATRELLAQAEPTGNPAGQPLPDLALSRRDSLSLPLSNGGALVFDMTNVGAARSEATSLTVNWDGQPPKSFFVPALEPGARTGLRMVVPEGVRTVTAELNPKHSFAEARVDNNRVVETVGEGPATSPPPAELSTVPPATATTTPPAATPRPAAATPGVSQTTRASPAPTREPAVMPRIDTGKPPRSPSTFPFGLVMILGAVAVVAAVIALVIAFSHRSPSVTKPRIVALPVFHTRPVTSHSAVRTPAVTPRDPHIRPHAPPEPLEAATHPAVWDVFQAGDHMTAGQRDLLDETACIKALRARVGNVGDAYWDHTYKALLETMHESMAMPLEQLLVSAFTRWAPLQPALTDSRTRLQEDIVVPTGTSTVAATHHVHVTAQLGGTLVRPGMGLVIEVACVFDACTFVVHQGRIAEIVTEGTKVEGAVRCDSAPVLRRELTGFALPRIVVVEPHLESRSPEPGAPVV